MSKEECTSKRGSLVQIDKGQVRSHLNEMVRDTVEETLNTMLDAEADRLVKAKRYERTEERIEIQADHYQRKFHSKAGEVNLKMPKLRTLPFEAAIIERFMRRKSSVEEALIEMNLAGIPVQRIEHVIHALWGTKVTTPACTWTELNAAGAGRCVTSRCWWPLG